MSMVSLLVMFACVWGGVVCGLRGCSVGFGVLLT